MVLNPDLLKRATYSKYFLRRAKDLHRQGHELNSAEAVLAAHDSAEMLMRVVLDFLSIPMKRDDEGFMKFWQLVYEHDAKKRNPPHKGQMQRFNNIRVEL